MPLLIIIFFLEIVGRIVYFQSKSPTPLAIQTIYNKIKHTYLLSRAKSIKKNENLPTRWIDSLFSGVGKQLLEELKLKYEIHFKDLLDAVGETNSKFAILYIPSDDYRGKDLNRHRLCREFYITLSNKYKVDFIDMTDIFFQYDAEIVTLLPENGHLSRFGNKLIADKLNGYLSSYRLHRNNLTYKYTTVPTLNIQLRLNL